MRDYFNEMYEWDGNVPRKKKKQVLPEGARAHFTMHMMDNAAFGFGPTFSDGSPDHTSPHAPGYRFADVGDPNRLAAEQSYRARSRRMEDGWRRKDEQKDAAPRPRTLDAARQQADAAYQARSQRLSNLWRDRNRV